MMPAVSPTLPRDVGVDKISGHLRQTQWCMFGRGPFPAKRILQQTGVAVRIELPHGRCLSRHRFGRGVTICLSCSTVKPVDLRASEAPKNGHFQAAWMVATWVEFARVKPCRHLPGARNPRSLFNGQQGAQTFCTGDAYLTSIDGFDLPIGGDGVGQLPLTECEGQVCIIPGQIRWRLPDDLVKFKVFDTPD